MGIPSAVESIVEFFITAINGERFRRGEHVPRMRDVAKETGFSRVSVWKAVSLLRRAGIVEGVRGGRVSVRTNLRLPLTMESIIATGKPPPTDPVSAPTPTAARIARTIERDILTGSFPRGKPLPSLKELQTKYAANYRTVRKALSMLSRRRLVTRTSRRYTVRKLTRDTTAHSIVLIVHVEKDAGFSLSQLNEHYLFFFEQQCLQAGISPRTTLYLLDDQARPTYLSPSGARLNKLDHHSGVLGYIVLVLHPRHGYERVVRDCAACGVPVALLDEIGDIRLPSTGLTRPMAVFPIGTSTRAAQAVGQYLLMLGHRSIAYISPFQATAWSRIRLDGLRDVFSDPAGHGSVTPFTLNYLANVSEYFVDRGLDESRGRELLSWYESWRTTVPQRFRGALDDVIYSTPLNVFGECAFKPVLRELFSRALRHRDITAWVCANDAVAIDALDFLRERSVSVPGAISVVAFDNERRGMDHGLTTYDFSMRSIVDAMISFLTRPTEFLRNHRNPYVEIGGVIVERATTGPARG